MSSVTPIYADGIYGYSYTGLNSSGFMSDAFFIPFALPSNGSNYMLLLGI